MDQDFTRRARYLCTCWSLVLIAVLTLTASDALSHYSVDKKNVDVLNENNELIIVTRDDYYRSGESLSQDLYSIVAPTSAVFDRELSPGLSKSTIIKVPCLSGGLMVN